MKLEIDRSACSHEGSMFCDRCSARVLNFEKEGSCIVDFDPENPSVLTLVVRKDGQVATYDVPVHALHETEGEGWETTLENIAPFKRE